MKTKEFKILAEACGRAYMWFENRADACETLYEEHARIGNERGVDERAVRAAKNWGFEVGSDIWQGVAKAYDVSVRMRNRLGHYCAKIRGLVAVDEETWAEGLRVLKTAREAGGKKLEEYFGTLDMALFN